MMTRSANPTTRRVIAVSAAAEVTPISAKAAEKEEEESSSSMEESPVAASSMYDVEELAEDTPPAVAVVTTSSVPTPHGPEGVESGAPEKKRRRTANSGSSASTPAPSKKEAAVQQFLSDVLPSLRKEMQKKRKQTFKLSDYAHAFTPNSKTRPTYILPLLHFLGKQEIVCSRYGVFDGRHVVKTTAGFDHVLFVSRNTELTSEEDTYLLRRFGKEWHKIPAKDQHKVGAAHKLGHMGMFKITLIGVYEDSFTDAESGEVIRTLNPVLTYEPVRPPADKAGGGEKGGVTNSA